MPITNFSLGPDVSFWGEAEVGWAAEFAASVENGSWQAVTSRAAVGPDPRAVECKNRTRHGPTG